MSHLAENSQYIYEYKQTNKRFTLYPISLTNLDRTNGHVLYMLYDKKFNIIEVFDNTTHINHIINTKHQFFTNFRTNTSYPPTPNVGFNLQELANLDSNLSI